MKLINRIRAIRLTERQVLRIYLGMVVLLVGLWAADSAFVLQTPMATRSK